MTHLKLPARVHGGHVEVKVTEDRRFVRISEFRPDSQEAQHVTLTAGEFLYSIQELINTTFVIDADFSTWRGLRGT